MVPVICASKNLEDPTTIVREILESFAQLFQSVADEALRAELGFLPDHEAGDPGWKSLESPLWN